MTAFVQKGAGSRELPGQTFNPYAGRGETAARSVKEMGNPEADGHGTTLCPGTGQGSEYSPSECMRERKKIPLPGDYKSWVLETNVRKNIDTTQEKQDGQLEYGFKSTQGKDLAVKVQLLDA